MRQKSLDSEAPVAARLHILFLFLFLFLFFWLVAYCLVPFVLPSAFPQLSANEREGPRNFSWRRVQTEPLGTGEQLAGGGVGRGERGGADGLILL